MPSLIVPLGSDATGMAPNLSVWIESFFHANHPDSDQSAVVAQVASSSSVVGTDPLGATDTASYASANGPSFKAGLPAGAPWRDTSSSAGSGSIAIGGRQTTAADFPADAFNIVAELVIIARDSADETFQVDVLARDEAGTTLLSSHFIDFFTTAAFTEYRITLGNSRPMWITALADRHVYAYLTPGTFYSDGVFDVAYLAVEFTFDLPTPPDAPGASYHRTDRVTPSLRMLQRGGMGGIGGIPRMVGNPTEQGSLRSGPGSVF